MSITPALPFRREQASIAQLRPQARSRRALLPATPFRFPANIVEMDAPYRNAELFYLQKQIQSQTPMVIVLEDGELVEGCIEWYDRNAIKVRGATRMLIYKDGIKYMYKAAERHG